MEFHIQNHPDLRRADYKSIEIIPVRVIKDWLGIDSQYGLKGTA